MRKRYISLSAALMLSASIFAQKKPNIILFLVDDMGWQDTSLPFTEQKTELNKIYETPNMERLAQMGVKFTSAYANSVSSPTRVSLLTGANVTQHKVSNWTLEKGVSTDGVSEVLDFEGWNVNGISPEKETEQAFYMKALPAILNENGYATMMVGKAHFGALGTPAQDPLAIGFEKNIAGHAAGRQGSYLGENGYGNIVPEGEKKNVWAVPHLEAYYGTDMFLTDVLTIEAEKLMDKALADKKPFFMYMSHYAVHIPFDTDVRFYQKYIDKGLPHKEAQYASLLEGMDKSLGDLIDYVNDRNIADNTVILFMSDNGGLTVDRDKKNAPLRGGKGSLFEGGIREPMIVYTPTATPNTVSDAPVIAEDFFASILDWAGVEDLMIPQHMDGVSFKNIVEGEKADKDRALFFHYPNHWNARLDDAGYPQSAIVEHDWKLIYDYETKETHLYNLIDDLSETNNLANEREMQYKVQYLSDKLSDYLKRQEATMPVEKGTQNRVEYPDGSK